MSASRRRPAPRDRRCMRQQQSDRGHPSARSRRSRWSRPRLEGLLTSPDTSRPPSSAVVHERSLASSATIVPSSSIGSLEIWTSSFASSACCGECGADSVDEHHVFAGRHDARERMRKAPACGDVTGLIRDRPRRGRCPNDQRRATGVARRNDDLGANLSKLVFPHAEPLSCRSQADPDPSPPVGGSVALADEGAGSVRGSGGPLRAATNAASAFAVGFAMPSTDSRRGTLRALEARKHDRGGECDRGDECNCRHERPGHGPASPEAGRESPVRLRARLRDAVDRIDPCLWPHGRCGGADGDHPRARYVRWRPIGGDPSQGHDSFARPSTRRTFPRWRHSVHFLARVGQHIRQLSRPQPDSSQLPRTGRKFESGSALLAVQDGSLHRIVALRSHRTDRDSGNPFPARGPVSAIHTQIRTNSVPTSHTIGVAHFGNGAALSVEGRVATS